jgi:hypothetical protein
MIDVELRPDRTINISVPQGIADPARLLEEHFLGFRVSRAEVGLGG